jgi:hypothetical protein
MRENSELLFRRKEVKGCELASSRAAWGEWIPKDSLHDWDWGKIEGDKAEQQPQQHLIQGGAYM